LWEERPELALLRYLLKREAQVLRGTLAHHADDLTLLPSSLLSRIVAAGFPR